MMITPGQVAGLGMRNRLARCAWWAVVSLVAAGLAAAASVVLAALPYLVLLTFTIYRLVKR